MSQVSLILREDLDILLTSMLSISCNKRASPEPVSQKYHIQVPLAIYERYNIYRLKVIRGCVGTEGVPSFETKVGTRIS